MATNLVIIEAPGKTKSLGGLLWQAGVRDNEVLATVGHLGTNPDGFDPLAIDAGYRETAYRLKPEKEALAAKIARAANSAINIYLATDDDQEGDVIARDVLRFCIEEGDKGKVKRVRLKALAPSEIREVFRKAQPFDDLSAARGDARRIIDRLIGSLSSEVAAVGRVQGSLLLQLAQQSPVTGVATYLLPAADDRGDFIAKVPLYGVDPAVVPLRFDDVVAEPGRSSLGVLASQALNHDDIVLAASLESGAAIRDVSRAMQSLYEKGHMTYPRSRAHEITPEASRRVLAMARANGAGFNPALFKAVRTIEGEHAHEAPNPLILDVPLNGNSLVMDLEQHVLLIIARHLVECGIPAQAEEPRLMDLAKLPPEVAALPWHRVVPQGERLWEARPIEAGIERWTAEQSLLHFMSRNELGRPSTIIDHVGKFLSRNLVTEAFDLTEKGNQWGHHVGELFGHQNISKMIENYLDDHKKSPSLMVEDMIELCGLSAVGSAVQQQQGLEHDDETDALSAYDLP
jgi:DNA topoisomerase-1